MRPPVTILLLLFVVLGLSACSTMPKACPATVARVDLDRYLGRWYVISHVPYFLEKGKVATYDTYARRPDGKLVNNFTFRPGERVLVAEDVVTRGGRAQECLDILKANGATAVAVVSLVDRSAGQTKFSVPFVSLLELNFPTFAADAVPAELAQLPATKPGS
jgi:adenine/guanine phosphoribosyltransferase-like PRPP-binding protein